jgi:hypothetical protein
MIDSDMKMRYTVNSDLAKLETKRQASLVDLLYAVAFILAVAMILIKVTNKPLQTVGMTYASTLNTEKPSNCDYPISK